MHREVEFTPGLDEPGRKSDLIDGPTFKRSKSTSAVPEYTFVERRGDAVVEVASNAVNKKVKDAILVNSSKQRNAEI